MGCAVRKPTGDILAISRVKEIHARIPNTHLVMHGSSSVPQDLLAKINQFGGKMKETYGVPVEEIQEAIKFGVRKINIDTDIRLAMTAEPLRSDSEGDATPEPGDLRPLALIVDDSITMRRVTQRLLEKNDFRVLTARDGIDALTVLEAHRPDLVLLDVEMPRMDGYELAAHMRNNERLAAIPIVMVTSRVGNKHRARALELGVDDYLGKPYQEQQLLEIIAPLLQRQSAAS